MPMFDCQTLEIMGIEVLVRSNHPSLEGGGPDKFIPVAETTGLINELDLWVIDNSLSTIKDLQRKNYKAPTVIRELYTSIPHVWNSTMKVSQIKYNDFWINTK